MGPDSMRLLTDAMASSSLLGVLIVLLHNLRLPGRIESIFDTVLLSGAVSILLAAVSQLFWSG